MYEIMEKQTDKESISKRDIILNESFRLFLKKGYAAVSFSDLVEATGISRGNMFHHFKNKEDIFNHAVDRFVFEFLTNDATDFLEFTSSTPSELTSPALVSKFYDPEYEATHDNPDKDPYMAFEKDFMRFMLSDGAGAVLVQDHPEGICPLKIEWVDMTSYANELPTCMFMASESQENGRLKSWKEVIAAYGTDKWDYPDPSCPYAPNVYNDIYL